MVLRPRPYTELAAPFRGSPSTASEPTPGSKYSYAVGHLSGPCAQAVLLVCRLAARVALAVAGDAARCWELLVTGVKS